ncbi:MAG TPA: hypothetical protein VG755_19655 [Nannocystaceae bacterium]|nr:hypothetical protein [Nannocystaceae bacterium]
MRSWLWVATWTIGACAGRAVDPEPSAPALEPSASTTQDPVANAPVDPPRNDDELAPLLREVATAYRSWGMVDNQFHWAPGLCAMPMEGVMHSSAAEGEGAHAQKVFVLYASDAMGYWKSTDEKGRLPKSLAQPHVLTSRGDVAQVLVKESFVPAKLGEGSTAMHGHVRPAKKGDETFVAGDPMGLFVMAQLTGRPANTDDGWIYATIAPDGTIGESGVIATCRDCHAKEKDRIFGVPLAWK